MKKILLSAVTLAALSMTSYAQRMALHEEFTGENCPPCAGTNPGFWALCDSVNASVGINNPTKLIHISYMEPIPSSGWYYLRTKALSDNRASFYNVPFAPYGRLDGKIPSASASTTSPGHPGYFTQAEINTAAAIIPHTNVAVSAGWDATYANVITTVTITPTMSYAATVAKLRVALVQTNDFASSPGTNGEVHFANVVQGMYPDANGTALTPSTWTIGTPVTITLTCPCPSFVDKNATNRPYMVAWVQNDADSVVDNAAQTTLLALPKVPVDIASSSITVPQLSCATGTTYSATHSFVLKNTGTATLTAANIYTSVDGGAFTATPWTGSLAAGATATVAMSPISVSVTAPAFHTVVDSVDDPNGSADLNPANNAVGSYFFVQGGAAGAMPYTTSFEGTDYNVHYSSGVWAVYTSAATAPLGHTGTNAAKYNYNATAAGVANIFTLPSVTTSAKSSMDFYVADCQIASTNTDKLEVVYSTDCGTTWTSVWSQSGATLAGAIPPNSSTYFTPTSAAQYTKFTASLNSVPANSMLAFRATSGGGQNLWLDDINIHSTLEVNTIAANTENIAVYPNPATTEATLSFNLTNNSDVQVQVVDGLGRVVSTIANEKMTGGMHTVAVNTATLANGVYNIMIHTESGVSTQRLTVAK